MRVLVAYASKRGGTAGIAQTVRDVLAEAGLRMDLAPASRRLDPAGYDAVIAGGALYAGRWHRAARRFVRHRADALRARPVWLFSSGPLDDSAAARDIPPVRKVRALARTVGARGHATFGGRLRPDATGFPAGAMAKTHAGDWRDPARIRAWAAAIAADLGAPAVAARGPNG